ncbi:unnamed protein product [Microthlaspi erraticum]|uniref:Uncharacterized protein n=1 Tax=Microthlaspi erraticum TaxID=1685480 RepID=A0A6D2K9V4_9BRAS|nr:unnamed protein product [Microthlaspi erraticum]
MRDLREEEPELDRAEDRAETSSGMRIWGKPWKDAKVHGQDGEQDQSLEKKVSGSSSKKKKSKAPTSLGVDHSSPLQGGSLPKSLTEPLLSSQGKEKTTRREGGRASKARRSSSTTGLDRVQTEETQLDRAEVELTWRSPCLRTGFEYDPTPTRTSLRDGPLQPLRAASSTKAKGATHTSMKKRKKRSRKLDRVFWSILEHMGREEHGGTWHMDAAQLDTQRKKGEAILKTSSTNRSSSSTRPAKLQLDRAEKSKSNPKNVASPLTFL